MMVAMDPEQKNSNAGEPERKKKPYRRPEILYRETLEVMAALCVPSPPAKRNPGQCPSGPIAS
jgi:hypothetical protein